MQLSALLIEFGCFIYFSIMTAKSMRSGLVDHSTIATFVFLGLSIALFLAYENIGLIPEIVKYLGQ